MLKSAHQRLVDGGAVPLRSYEDYTGVWGYRVDIEGEQYILVAKSYDHEGKASFLVEAVDRAIKADDWLLFYNDETELYTVFDPEYVDENGVDSEGGSKTRDAEWKEIPMSAGVGLTDYISGRSYPERCDATDQTSLFKL